MGAGSSWRQKREGGRREWLKERGRDSGGGKRRLGGEVDGVMEEAGFEMVVGRRAEKDGGQSKEG